MKLLSRNRRSPIGIDVGSGYIKAVQLSHGNGCCRIDAAANFERAVCDGPLDQNELARLCDVLHRRGFHGSNVVLAVPDERLLTGLMELPVRAAGISLDGVARAEFARTHKCDAQSFEMAYWDLPSPSRANRATHVMAVACPHREAERLVDTFDSVGLDVCGLDSRAWAMSRACEPGCAGMKGIVLMLELGRNSAVLVARHEQVVIYQRTLEEASLKRLNDTMVRDLKLAPDIVEHILSAAGLRDPQAASRTDWDWVREARGVITAHFEAIAKDLQASIAYIGNLYPDAAIDCLMVCGGGTAIPGVVEHLQQVMGFEARLATPLLVASATPGIARDCTAAMTTATGLALYPTN